MKDETKEGIRIGLESVELIDYVSCSGWANAKSRVMDTSRSICFGHMYLN